MPNLRKTRSRPLPPSRTLVPGVPLLVLSLLLLLSPAARAAAPIEGVWSFNGGRIAVKSSGNGTFTGTVVAPTKFSLCTHPVGEEIWTQMAAQPDGSYWGLHQWFYETSECFRNPSLGASVWRVLESPQGRYLRVCLSEPGSNLQPTIAADGTSANATFGCVDSALLSQVPRLASLSRYVRFPSNRKCLSRHRLRIQIHNPENDPIKRVRVTATGGGVTRKARIARKKYGFLATLRLAAIPGGSVTVRIRMITTLGQKLSGKRVYRRCGASG